MSRSLQPDRSLASGRASLLLLLCLLLGALAGPAAAAPAPTPDPAYAALRAAKPDGPRVAVSGLVLERDVFRFQFDSGAFYLLSPVEGRTPGAVFVGQGSYRLVPATETERQHLALVSGGDKDFEVLSDSFEELVLLFTDGTASEIERHAAVQPGTPDPRAEAAWERHMRRQRKDFHTNFHLRLLADLLRSPDAEGPDGSNSAGTFLAFVDGKELPPALAAVDPEGAEALQPGSGLGREESLLLVSDPKRGGTWYLSDRRDEIVSGKLSPPHPRAVDALDYRIDTRVGSDDDLAGTTYVRFSVLSPGLRVLPVYLLPRLRLQSAAMAPDAGATGAAGGGEQQWTELPFVQEDREEDGDAAVVFPRPLDKGRTVELRFTYAGDEVLHDVGEHNYVVGARESWYPNLGVFSDPATFELTYRIPKGSEVISVGRLVDSRIEDERAVSVWVCDQPVQVAGFNYGRFRKLERKEPETGVEVVVYTGTGTPDVIREMNQFLASSRASAAVDFDDEDGGDFDEGGAPGVEVGDLNTDKLAQSALVDGLNSARIFTAYFGPLPEKRVAITQQSEWSYGQSWPSLIFLPYMAFLNGSQRARLGLSQAVDFINEVGYHEFAHQWWGHLVGWDSYRDQWLSEGFAEFSAALALQQVRGFPSYVAFWKDNREAILKKSPGDDLPPSQAGPVSLGYRLSTHRTPSASRLIYSKGGYVLHMLRMMMWDHTSGNPDAKFIAMMKDFVAANAGKHATAADFKKAIERHMLPQLDATGDGKMDWFFRQWIDGTEIPRYSSKLKVEKLGDAYKISGQVTQEGVSKDFYAYVPVYLDFGKGELARIGAIRMVGSASVPVDASLRLPKKPRKALINAAGDVLARE